MNVNYSLGKCFAVICTSSEENGKEFKYVMTQTYAVSIHNNESSAQKYIDNKIKEYIDKYSAKNVEVHKNSVYVKDSNYHVIKAYNYDIKKADMYIKYPYY